MGIIKTGLAFILGFGILTLITGSMKNAFVLCFVVLILLIIIRIVADIFWWGREEDKW
jgi:hypothetical protein